MEPAKHTTEAEMRTEVKAALDELEAVGLLRKTDEYRLSRDGITWLPVYEAVPIN